MILFKMFDDYMKQAEDLLTLKETHRAVGILLNSWDTSEDKGNIILGVKTVIGMVKHAGVVFDN